MYSLYLEETRTLSCTDNIRTACKITKYKKKQFMLIYSDYMDDTIPIRFSLKWGLTYILIVYLFYHKFKSWYGFKLFCYPLLQCRVDGK